MKTIISIATAAILLSGCAYLSQRYDSDLVNEVNTHHKSTIKFIETMAANAGTEKGAYTSTAAQDYYASSKASIENMLIRAQLLSDRACPTSAVAALISQGVIEEAELEAGIATAAQVDGKAGTVQNPIGTLNCTAIVINHLGVVQAMLQSDHEESGKLTSYAARLNSDHINSSARIALKALTATQGED